MALLVAVGDLDGRSAEEQGGAHHGRRHGHGARGGGSLRRRGRAHRGADIDGKAAGETVALVEKKGGQALAVTGDVALEADVQRMIGEGVRRFGALHVLYNNAGVLWKDRDRSVLETDESRGIA